MRTTMLLMMVGVLILAACAPATDVPAPTGTPTAAALEETQPPVVPSPTGTPTAAAPEETQPPAETVPPAVLDGRALLQDRCTVCHSLGRIESASKTAEQWRATVNRMVGKGAVLTADELEVLVQYLAQTYP